MGAFHVQLPPVLIKAFLCTYASYHKGNRLERFLIKVTKILTLFGSYGLKGCNLLLDPCAFTLGAPKLLVLIF
jgi:hypothetical protein